MKLFRSILPVLALTLPVSADFATGIRAVLPPAQKAEVAAPAAAPKPEAPPTADASATAAPRIPAELSYTPDEGPAADVSPAAHAALYADFKKALKEQAEKNLYDFCPAMELVLKATNDPFAVQQWMEKAAGEGLAAAQQYVADQRLVHIRMDELQSAEVKAAYAMARKAADAGYDPAKVNVYMCLKNGVGVAKDEKAAEKYILEACKSKGFITRFKWLQLSGRLSTFEDRERAEVKAEIERGNDHVVYFISSLAPTAAEKSEWLMKAAKLGNPEALYMLSAMASQKNPKASFELLKEAIKLHSAEGMFTLGVALTDADPNSELMKTAGIGHDDKTGRHLVKLAGMLGSVSAHTWLGHMYHDGVFGVQQNDAVSYRWFEKGALSGSLRCSTAQGVMLLRGIGTQKEEKRGLAYLNAAANAGNPEAVMALAYAVYSGIGVEANARKAAEMLEEAAAMGNPAAYICLAYITSKGGVDLPADPKRAERYIRLAKLDMKDEAQQLYDKLMAEGWVPEP